MLGKSPPRPQNTKTMAIAWLMILGLLAFLFSLPSKAQKSKEPEPFAAHWYCRKQVESKLKSPSTADFADFDEVSVKLIADYGHEKLFAAVVQVEAQNSFGVPLKSSWGCHVSFKRDSGGEWLVKVHSVKQL